MYALAVASQVQPDKTDEAASIFRDSVVPTYQQLSGFKGALLLIDPATGKSLGISLVAHSAEPFLIARDGSSSRRVVSSLTRLT
jgi:hypothetical protein